MEPSPIPAPNAPTVLSDPNCLRGLDSIVRAVERVMEAYDNRSEFNPALNCKPSAPQSNRAAFPLGL